ncbi:MAG: pyruvate kinase [Euryarchaeota archaeon HGW-Euryarchaeota-1]|nr:MAG: pyruvate kinase [Euryarchaeota archaeon HGW-Euryarchaeota-1]
MLIETKTKLVATIGPSSESRENLMALIKAGVNVVRLNFSHGDHSSHGKIIKLVREISAEIKRPIGILADLQGPRIRVGNLEKLTVKKDEIILVSDKKTTDEKELIIDSDGVCSSLQVGERILIEDGVMRLDIVDKTDNIIKAKVINGGEIKPRKGINVPDTKLGFGAVTEKDKGDLEFALKNEVDFVALSFVGNAQEILETKEKIERILNRNQYLPQIVSKIERKEAIKNLDEIIKASDVIMVARGDLGIEMEESKVVLYQKEIISKCLMANKPVIVATQMLDSMINNPIPTRAEVSDVTNAVIDNADAVMLSGESANGKYPVEAVKMMKQIIVDVENSQFKTINSGYLDDYLFDDYASLINGAHEIAKSSNAKAIVMYSHRGFTARRMSHHRLKQLIITATNDSKTYNQLALVWGVRAYLFDDRENRERSVDSIIEKVKNEKILNPEDKIVILLGRTPKDQTAWVGIKKIE